MGTTFDVITKLHTVNCGSCGGIYAIQERYRAQCEEEGKGWHCPYCKCNWGYFNDNENARLKKQLKAAEAEQERLKRTAQFQKEQKERGGERGGALPAFAGWSEGAC
jgi:hypothetical protein